MVSSTFALFAGFHASSCQSNNDPGAWDAELTAHEAEQLEARAFDGDEELTLPELGGADIATPEPVVISSRDAFRIDRRARFFSQPDGPIRSALSAMPIARIERGSGGRSLGFKITLSDGTRGYFKPEQTFSGAHWYSEVAAYYLDRELGFGRVTPVIGRRMRWEPLRRAARSDRRLSEVIVQNDGTVRGAFIHWIDGGLPRMRLGRDWERWVRIEGPLALTPFQRPLHYRQRLRGEITAEQAPRFQTRRAPDEPSEQEQAAELSDMIVFDFLIANVDRWGGGFTNLRTRGAAGPLLFFDNGAGFWPNARTGLMDTRLASLQKFRRRTVERLRAFDEEAFAARLAGDPLAPVLRDRPREAVGVRVDAVIAHVESLVERFGEDEVLVW